MLNFHVQCYPWDLVDEGISAALDRIYGQLGANGVILVVACDALSYIRPHAVEPRVYSDEGGVFFKPTTERYDSTRLKPPTWSLHRKLDVLAAVSEGCADRQLDLRLALWPLRSRRLVHKHPEVAQKNILHASSRTTLCPQNPDVQAYLTHLVEDLSVYDDASGLILHEALHPQATDTTVSLGQLARVREYREILSTCFCESCLQCAERADIDALAARRGAQVAIEHIFTCGRPQRDYEQHEHLQRYRSFFARQVDDLIGNMRKSAGKPFTVALEDDPLAALGGDTNAPPDGVDQLCLDSMPRDVWSTAHPERVELRMKFDSTGPSDAQMVVQMITGAAENRLAGVVVSHYGAILEEQIEWLHQGIRNARRISVPAKG